MRRLLSLFFVLGAVLFTTGSFETADAGREGRGGNHHAGKNHAGKKHFNKHQVRKNPGARRHAHQRTKWRMEGGKRRYAGINKRRGGHDFHKRNRDKRYGDYSPRKYKRDHARNGGDHLKNAKKHVRNRDGKRRFGQEKWWRGERKHARHQDRTGGRRDKDANDGRRPGHRDNDDRGKDRDRDYAHRDHDKDKPHKRGRKDKDDRDHEHGHDHAWKKDRDHHHGRGRGRGNNHNGNNNQNGNENGNSIDNSNGVEVNVTNESGSGSSNESSNVAGAAVAGVGFVNLFSQQQSAPPPSGGGYEGEQEALCKVRKRLDDDTFVERDVPCDQIPPADRVSLKDQLPNGTPTCEAGMEWGMPRFKKCIPQCQDGWRVDSIGDYCEPTK